MPDIAAIIAANVNIWIGVLASVLGLILTVATLHQIIANRGHTQAQTMKTLWDRIDALEIKLDEEISKRDKIILQLQATIETLKRRLRSVGIDPDEHDATPTKRPPGLWMR